MDSSSTRLPAAESDMPPRRSRGRSRGRRRDSITTTTRTSSSGKTDGVPARRPAPSPREPSGSENARERWTPPRGASAAAAPPWQQLQQHSLLPATASAPVICCAHARCAAAAAAPTTANFSSAPVVTATAAAAAAPPRIEVAAATALALPAGFESAAAPAAVASIPILPNPAPPGTPIEELELPPHAPLAAAFAAFPAVAIRETVAPVCAHRSSHGVALPSAARREVYAQWLLGCERVCTALGANVVLRDDAPRAFMKIARFAARTSSVRVGTPDTIRSIYRLSHAVLARVSEAARVPVLDAPSPSEIDSGDVTFADLTARPPAPAAAAAAPHPLPANASRTSSASDVFAGGPAHTGIVAVHPWTMARQPHRAPTHRPPNSADAALSPTYLSRSSHDERPMPIFRSHSASSSQHSTRRR
jgi:hypothetical protein